MRENQTREQPVLETERLLLRPFEIADAADVQRLAGAKEVAATTLHIPHPYEDGMAEQWIGTHREAFESRRQAVFAIVVRDSRELCGAIGLGIAQAHTRAELGYWVGVPYWNKGYCSEAAAAVIAYGFDVLKLHRIAASHFASNPASGRVMQKIGMLYEGYRTAHIKRWDEYHDLVEYGILAGEARGKK